MTDDKLTRSVRDYLARIGQKGGEARGNLKRRGGPEYYRALARKRWEKRKTGDL